MKTNNRPMIKATEYRYYSRSRENECWRESPNITMDKGYYCTGKKREVEREMNNEEYIEYLEKKFDKLKKDYDQECIDHTGTTDMLHKRICEQQEKLLDIFEDAYYKVIGDNDMEMIELIIQEAKNIIKERL